jgi:N-acyl-D-aspartate/D-glutamate deacylase
MKRYAALASFAVLYLLIGALNLPAQDLVITNARIIVGNGTVIDRGSIVIRGGRLTSVAAGAPANASGVQGIDAHGMTAMPGFIDAHRHVNTGRTRRRTCRIFSTQGTRPFFQAAALPKAI